MSEYLALAEILSSQAGEIMQTAREQHLRIYQKQDMTVVTNVDYLINDLVIEGILRVFPHHRIEGEEKSYGSPTAEHIWHVDPLDGTGEYITDGDSKAFTYGFGIAKRYRNKLEMGLFYNPSRDELYTAVHGLGSRLNGRPIQVNQQIFETGIEYDYSDWDGASPNTQKFRDVIGEPLNHYSAIYQACMVASGNSVFSVFPGSTAHDIAPGIILVNESKGRASDINGNTHNWNSTLKGALFSNGLVHREVLDMIRDYK